MYLASPHLTGPLAEHISIDLYVAAIADPDIRMFVMSKDPKTLEEALTHSIRYEALLLGSTEQTQPAVLDPASYVYDDKDRKNESVGAVEIHQDTVQRNLETQKTVNADNQQKLADQQQQLDAWMAWNDKVTHLQSNQPQPAQYDWRQAGHASGGGPQSDTRPYTYTNRGRPGRGRGTHTSRYTQGDTNYSKGSFMCYNCGGEGHIAKFCEQPT